MCPVCGLLQPGPEDGLCRPKHVAPLNLRKLNKLDVLDVKCLSFNIEPEICLQTLLKKATNVTSLTQAVIYIPYILESNPHPNLIRTSFCRFLKRKKS